MFSYLSLLIKQIFSPTQLQKELLKSKNINCAKFANAILEAGEIHKINSYYFLNKKPLVCFESSSALFCIFIISGILIFRHTIKDIFFDVIISFPVLSVGLGLIFLIFLVISCGRGFQGNGPISTPKGIYQLMRSSEKQEKKVLCEHHRVQHPYELMNV
jgi:hypothetical protein